MIDSTKISSEFKEKIRNSVPSDFDLTQIGRIDLREAEKIASEEVIFLKEEDLIEGLEDFELIPLKENNARIEQTRDAGFTEIKTGIKPLSEKEPDVESIDDDVLVFDEIHYGKDIAGEKKSDVLVTDLVPETETGQPDTIKTTAAPAETEIESFPAQDIIETAVELPSEFEMSGDYAEQKISSQAAQQTPEKIESSQETGEKYNQMPDVGEIDEVFEDEFLPEKYSDITRKANVSFIDDRHVSKERDFSITAEDDQLTSRLSKMIDITKGKPKIIESDTGLFDNRYALEDQKTYDYEDETLYEEKFLTDTDFDFIDNSIIKEDFIQYIQEIDEYYSSETKYSQSEIAEIMGFARDEDKFFEEILFGDYFKDIDVDSELEFINPGLDFYSRSVSDQKDLIYLLDDPESLKDDERYSIEADISSGSAIVFEESIKDIESMLGEAPARLIVEKEYVQARKPIKESVETEPVIFEDITDKVIILDDLDNMNEFMETIPDKKEDLTRLLAYLDGLFEKLPEETVRKFADSEYFDLYVKVLKDMGV